MQTDWTQTEVTLNGAGFNLYRLGDAGRPPLVLQHGFSDNGLCWLRAARDLRDAYDVVMPDARGHGLSPRVQRGQKIDLTGDLAGILRGLGLERPIVAGHSMGAMMASGLGARYPDLPRALILEDPPWRLPDPSAEGASALEPGGPFEQWINSLADLPLEQVMEQSRAEHPTWADLVLRTWSQGKQQLDTNFFYLKDTGRMDWQQEVRQIACPTLVIIADPDKGGIITPEVAQMVQDMNDRISVVHIPGTGHHVRFENYAAYMDAVRAFLKEIEE
jgi:pimeloyl-ACP methyl ester carboxylesterase